MAQAPGAFARPGRAGCTPRLAGDDHPTGVPTACTESPTPELARGAAVRRNSSPARIGRRGRLAAPSRAPRRVAGSVHLSRREVPEAAGRAAARPGTGLRGHQPRVGHADRQHRTDPCALPGNVAPLTGTFGP